MPIICFFGPDGSGKSTVVKALAERLYGCRFRIKISWMRGTHTFASILAKFLAKFTTFQGSDNPYYNITIPRRLKKIWQLIELVSALPVILLRFIIPGATGRCVISERYTPDFVSWVSLTTCDPNYPKSIMAKFLLSLSSGAYEKIYVTATKKELIKRRKETNPTLINDQLKLYNKIALAIHAKRLDTTNKSVNESLECVLTLLNMRSASKTLIE